MGLIFDVQRFSLHDGPGIRTTVFFKGCNLCCKWCHNPESIKMAGQMQIYPQKCIGCGACHKACPVALCSSECSGCGACADVCYAGARVLRGEEITPDALMERIFRDRPFYAQSGGGVTFSGGECLLQVDFLEEMLRRCRAAGLTTAVDTAGHVPFASFERILPFTDLFLYDIKAATPSLHLAMTGVENGRIIENLRTLLVRGARVWVRIPLVPHVAGEVSEMTQIGRLLASLGRMERVELLTYHHLASAKYASLGMKYTMEDVHALNQAQSQALFDVLEAFGLPVMLPSSFALGT